MSNKNGLLIKRMEVYPLINDINKYFLVLTTQKNDRKFFIAVNKDEAEIIITYLNSKDLKKNFDVSKSTKYLLCESYFNVLKMSGCNVEKVAISMTSEKTFGKIFVNKKSFLVTMKVGVILSLQFQSRLYVTEDSFVFNENPFKEEIENLEKIKNYKFTFSPLKKYSKEFLFFLLENAKQQKNFEMAHFIEIMLCNRYKSTIDDKDFF